MRLALLAALCATLVPARLLAEEPAKRTLEMRSGTLITGLTITESPKPVFAIRLTGQVDKNGEGEGALELDPNPPKFDEFGFMRVDGSLPPVKVECALKVVKKTKMKMRESPRPGAPEVEVEWTHVAITGPKITSKFYLAHQGRLDDWAQFLEQGKDGKVRYALPLHAPGPPEPCHPGCFPAGTPIRTPNGLRPVERVSTGDEVTTMGADGKVTTTKVASVFVTRNRLIEVRTDSGSLITTTTQPLALADGGLRGAGELKPGDRIWRWENGERKATTVRSVATTGREEIVYNLVLGNKEIFIADGFLARSKPPAPGAEKP